MMADELMSAALLSTKMFKQAVVTNTIAIVDNVKCANSKEFTYLARSSSNLLRRLARLLPSLRSWSIVALLTRAKAVSVATNTAAKRTIAVAKISSVTF
jgi:hypothetical protein